MSHYTADGLKPGLTVKQNKHCLGHPGVGGTTDIIPILSLPHSTFVEYLFNCPYHKKWEISRPPASVNKEKNTNNFPALQLRHFHIWTLYTWILTWHNGTIHILFYPYLSSFSVPSLIMFVSMTIYLNAFTLPFSLLSLVPNFPCFLSSTKYQLQSHSIDHEEENPWKLRVQFATTLFMGKSRQLTATHRHLKN